MTSTTGTTNKGSATRERILTVAESIILQKGYSGTSIDDILGEAHITKGGFFYHFDGKNDLAVGLMKRYRENDRIFFTSIADRAMELTEDPLQQFLLFLKMLAEEMADLPTVHPGCLVATFTYESLQVNDDVRDINREVILEWRELFRRLLDRADEKYEKKIEVDNDSLADALTSVIEGGIIVSKTMDDQSSLPEQILNYRNYIRLLYDAA